MKMTSGRPAEETITSDPVFIEVPGVEERAIADGTEKPATEEIVEEKTAEETQRKDVRSAEEVIELNPRHSRAYQGHPPPVVVYRNNSRSRSRSPIYQGRRVRPDYPVLANTAALNDLLKETDACFETLKGQLIYLTTHAFHTADIQKFSWLFTIGAPDAWSQKPTNHIAGTGFLFDLPRGHHMGRGRNDFYDDELDMRYPRAAHTPIATLGAALRIFGSDEEPEAQKIKFVIAVQAKGDTAWVKLLVCYSRQAAITTIFHEMLNGQTIAFVGAVLKDVAIPAENPNKKPKKLQRVGTVKEAQDVDSGVIGVIC